MTGRIQVTAEVVGIGSDGTEPSLVFAVHRRGVYSTEQTLLKRYLFNCGEGTQRLCGENGIKLNSLDSIFLTRLDVQSASGIPGLVFALGGLGAAQLSIHGPPGTRDRLSAMQSFVRRKYPRLECVEMGSSLGASSSAPNHKGDGTADVEIPRRAWTPGEAQEDQHASIIALTIGADSAANDVVDNGKCWVCASCTPLPERKPEEPKPLQTKETDDEKDPDRRWLRRFYTAKAMSDKIPHMDAILRRYRGRIDELKSQLTLKYGSVDSDSASGSDSSSDSDSDSDSDADNSVFDATAPLDRKWLESFYQQHEPAKLARIDHVLRQFAGREDQLKAMLLAKYGAAANSSSSEVDASAQPPMKKQKVEGASTITESEPDEIAEAYSDVSEKEETTHCETETPAVSLCYIIQFRSPPHPVVWVVDCQSTTHIQEMTAKLPLYASAATVDSRTCTHRPVLVVHFSPQRVLRDSRYQSWMTQLNGGDIQHLVFDGRALHQVNGGVFSFAFPSSARHYLRNRGHDGTDSLGSLRWQALQELLGQELHNKPLQVRILKRFPGLESPAQVAQAKLQYVLRDSAVVDYSQTGWKYVLERKTATATGTTKGTDEEDEEEETSVLPSIPLAPHRQPQHTRRLTILGTGSAAPSKLRASTSMYLALAREPVDGVLPGILIDCGEGAYGQLQRHLESEDALTARLAGLKCIWISHHHADHQCGLLRVLDEYARRVPAPSHAAATLYVVAPLSVLAYVKAWLPNLPSRIQLVTCAEMNDNASLRSALCRSSSIQELRSVRVWHCHDAYGLVLILQDGTKFVYSGDTKPCEQLIRAGLDASLLVHEATFDDTMADDADKKKHSTVGQAIEVGRRMRAQRVVLTHFSQRYPSLPPPMASSACTVPVDCAYDGFGITF